MYLSSPVATAARFVIIIVYSRRLVKGRRVGVSHAAQPQADKATVHMHGVSVSLAPAMLRAPGGLLRHMGGANRHTSLALVCAYSPVFQAVWRNEVVPFRIKVTNVAKKSIL
jgi:hypothetical protein